jgi:hypothetical protein
MSKEQRKKENEALIERMRNGESLTAVSVSSTWWPPRPVIKKDLSLLFGEKTPAPKLETVNDKNWCLKGL